MGNKPVILAALQFFRRLSCLYEGRFLKPLWNKYPNRESDEWDALILFLEGYAFARQGAPSGFTHAAVETVRQLRAAGCRLVDPNVPSKAWTTFSNLLSNIDLNHANNPLCPKGTPYSRKFKGVSRVARTSRLSAFEFLGSRPSNGGSANIVLYAKQYLERNTLRTVHRQLSGSNGINGIGSKIASFFLRDVATFYHILPSKDRHTLQPIDAWVRRISAQLMGTQTSDEQVAMWIVREAAKRNINPEAVNQGMWYFGSQVGGSAYRVSRALHNFGYAKDLLDEHIHSLRSALDTWQQIQAVN